MVHWLHEGGRVWIFSGVLGNISSSQSNATPQVNLCFYRHVNPVIKVTWRVRVMKYQLSNEQTDNCQQARSSNRAGGTRSNKYWTVGNG